MENKDYLFKAILKLRPNSEFAYSNRDYSTIQWHKLEGTAPTQAEVEAEIARLKTEEVQEEQAAAAAKQALLDRLGITADEARLLLS